MSNRTRSNPKFDKMSLSYGLLGSKTLQDRAKTISELVSTMEKNKKKLATEQACKNPDEAFVKRCSESIKNCRDTIKRELRIICKDESTVTKIVESVENADFNNATSNVLAVLSKYNPQVYSGR